MSNLIKLKRGSGSDPQASDLVVGEVAVRTDTGKLFTKKDDNSVAEIGVTALGDNDVTTAKIADDAVTYAKIQNVSATNRILGRDSSGAGAIEEITPANLRTMLNVADGATNVTNTNQLTNGAGFITATLTEEQVEDFVGGMVTGNTETGITVTYQDSDGTLDFVVGGLANAQIDASAAIAGTKISPDFGSQNVVTTGTLGSGDISITGSQPALNFIDSGDNPDYILYNNNGALRLHDSTNSADRFVVNTDGHVDVTGNLDVGAGLDVTGSISVSGTVDGRDVAADGTKLDGIASGATNVTNTNQLTNGAGFITATLTNEQVQDIVGAMVSGNTESGISVTYQDGDGTLDFVVGTLNQDTTGNAATATKLATARTIAGVSFDGSANISLNNNAITNGAGYLTSVGTSNISDDAVTYAKIQNVSAGSRVLGRISGAGIIQELSASELRTLINVADGATNVSNNNQLTNGAGYITSADGGNAATLDSIDSSQFLRSDADDSTNNVITITNGLAFGADAKCPAALSSLSDGSTITVDFTSGIHHSVTLGGNRTFGDPSNTGSAIGQSGSIFITQDGTGSRTASFHADYKFVGGTAPTLSTAANAVDRIDYVVKASNVVHCAISLDVK